MKFRLPVLALGAAAALAEPPPGPPPGPNIEKWTQDLSLSESQQAEVKRIFDAQRAKMDSEMHTRHEQADAELHQQLASVLSTEQLAKFDEMRKRQRPPGPPPGEDGGQTPR